MRVCRMLIRTEVTALRRDGTPFRSPGDRAAGFLNPGAGREVAGAAVSHVTGRFGVPEETGR